MVYDSLRGGDSLPTTVNWPVNTALVSVDSNCLEQPRLPGLRCFRLGGLASSALPLAKPTISAATLKHLHESDLRACARLSAWPSANASRKEPRAFCWLRPGIRVLTCSQADKGLVE